MNSKVKNKILLPTLTVLIASFAIVPALSQQGFAETDVRTNASQNVSVLEDSSVLIPEISEVRPVDVFENESKVKFRGGTDGWSLVGGYALDSGIYIEGTAVRGEDGIWKVEAEGKIKVEKREAKLVLKGQAYDGHLILRGTGMLDSGPEFRISLVGNYAPTLTEGQYALEFNGAYIQFSENGFRLPMMQVGKVFVSPA